MVESAGSVAVVGAGIIGISTALEIQALIPGAQVTIFSEDVSPDTTADGAAGIFGLYLMGATPTEDQVHLKDLHKDNRSRLKIHIACLLVSFRVGTMGSNHTRLDGETLEDSQWRKTWPGPGLLHPAEPLSSSASLVARLWLYAG